MVALSAAQGFAQITGQAAAVIIHVDVGTQVGVILVPDNLLAISFIRHWLELFTTLTDVEYLC